MTSEPTPSDITSRPSGTKSKVRILTILGAGTALSLLGDSTLYTVLPDPANAAIAGVSLTAVGFILGANRLTRMVTNPLVGSLYDRFPRRSILLPAMLLGFLCTLIYAFGSGLPFFLLGRVLWGFAWSGIWIGGNSVILDITVAGNRGKLSGLYQTWFFIGVGSSALLAGVFTDVFGFRGGLMLSAALNAAAVLLWFFLLPETRSDNALPDPTRAGSDDLDWRTILLASLPTFGMRFVYAGVIASTSILWLAQLFQTGLPFQNLALPLATITGIFVALRTVTSMLSGPIAGELSDRLTQRWIVIAGLMLLGGSGTWLMGTNVIPLAILGGFIASIPGGGVQALIPAFIGDQINEEHESRALGIVYTFGDFGSALGPVAALGLLERLGLNVIYRVCALLLILLAILAWIQSRQEATNQHQGN
ncbi:MAG: MFS transporter [Anaerolineales bacterium]|jgi:MFS family permease